MILILKYWKPIITLIVIATLVAIWQIEKRQAYQACYHAGYREASVKITAKLVQAQQAQAEEVRIKEKAVANKLAAAQFELEREKQHAKKSIANLRHQLKRVQERVAHERGRTNVSTTAATPSASDGEALTQGWQLFGECSSKYAELAQVADEQNADLHEWQAYGEIIERSSDGGGDE